MSGELVIKALLAAAAPVTALVGTRQYSVHRPEGDPLPAIVWEEISDAPRPPIARAPIAGTEAMTGRIQVNCLGRSSAEVKSLKDAVATACHAQSGLLGGVQVTAVLQSSAGPRQYDALVDTYYQSVDFIVHYYR
jgi:hypothetical protein